jgi:hypothetical protein
MSPFIVHHKIKSSPKSSWNPSCTWKSLKFGTVRVPFFVILGIYKEIVLIPSLTFDQNELCKINGALYYEHRLLINLLLLEDTNLTIYYVTSVPFDPFIIEYYQSLSPGGKPFGDRLKLISTFDSSSESLTMKLLSRPRLLNRIKHMIREPKLACILFNVSTIFERMISQKIQLPILAVNSDLSHLGTKYGSKHVFELANVQSPDSTHLCFDVQQLATQIARLIHRNPTAVHIMVKLNDSFSGLGNAIMTLDHVKSKIRKGSTKVGNLMEKMVAHELPSMRFSKETTWDGFSKRFADMGVIAEVFHETLQSPSCQGLIDEDQVVILSTHDQILSGLDHQIYSGCLFPASILYRLAIQVMTEKIGQTLYLQGVKGFFGVDYILSDSQIYAIEINLRVTGTTHPMLTMRYLVNGSIDSNGDYISTRSGKKKFYVCTDNLESPNLKKLQPQDVAEILQDHDLHYQHDKEIGCVMHMLGSLSEHGKMGITCIQDSADTALQTYEFIFSLLSEQATLE